MTEAQKICRICLKPFIEHPMGEKNGYKFTACKACGSIETAPWPTQETLDKFFGDIQPEAVHLPNPKNEIKHVKTILGKITRDFTGKRFLDAGCHQGYGVIAAKELGFQAHGIDAHDFFIAFAKDKYDPHLFEQATVQDYAAKGGQADIIYINEGFSEQIDPEGYTAALAKILSPKGKIYLHEPDGNHPRLPVNFGGWSFVDPPINFSYLSKKGMTALLWRHGLKIEKSFFTWSPFMRLVVVHK